MDSIEYEAISNYLDSKSYPLHSTREQKRIIRKKAKRYELVAGKLFRSLEGCQLLVIRHNELEGILKEIHDNSGHQCARYTCNIAKDRYHWPSMYKDIENYVTACVRCQKNQSSLKSPTTPLKPLPIITKVWYRVGMDLTGPLIESNGYKHILSMIDHFTRWIETRPLKSKEATEVARGIHSIYCRQGAPVRIITDNGTEFKNNICRALHETYNTKLIFSTPYHPQTNGLVESSHKAIKQALVK